MPRVLVVGSANVDFTVQTARLPEPGETVTDGTLLVAHGGKGANQAVAARRLGADVRLIACVGDDASGAAIRAALAREGIDPAGILVTPRAATGTALIVVDAQGRNQIAVAPGANRCLTVERVSARVEDLAWAEVVLCQLETPLPTVRWALEEARARGALGILNPAPARAGADALVPHARYVTPNEIEAARLSGVVVRGPRDAERAAATLRAAGAGAAVVTLGPAGALVCGADGVTHVPGFAVDVVDTTAAGDAFNGALAVRLAEGCALAAAVRFANAAGALACTRRGAQPSLPGRAEVERLLGG